MVRRSAASGVHTDDAAESVWDIHDDVGEPNDENAADDDDEDDDGDGDKDDDSDAAAAAADNADVQYSNTQYCISEELSSSPTSRSLSTPTHNGSLHLSTLFVNIKTGRTHQIRKHMDMLGNPPRPTLLYTPSLYPVNYIQSIIFSPIATHLYIPPSH